MITFTRNLRLAAIAFCAWGAGVFAAEKEAPASAAKDSAAQKSEAKSAPSTDAKKEAAAKENAAKENAKSAAKSSQQTLTEQFKAAQDFGRDHDALVKQLNNATEEKRKEILEKMKEREREFQEKLTQMRDDQRKQRQGNASKR